MKHRITRTARCLLGALSTFGIILLFATCQWAPTSSEGSITITVSGDMEAAMFSSSSGLRGSSIGPSSRNIVSQEEGDFEFESEFPELDDFPEEISFLFLYALEERALLAGEFDEDTLDEEELFTDDQLENFFFNAFFYGERARLSGRFPGGTGALVWSANDLFREGDSASLTLSGLKGDNTRYVVFAFYEIWTGGLDDVDTDDRYVMGVTTAVTQSAATTGVPLQMNLDEQAFDNWFIDEYGFLPDIFGEEIDEEIDEGPDDESENGDDELVATDVYYQGFGSVFVSFEEESAEETEFNYQFVRITSSTTALGSREFTLQFYETQDDYNNFIDTLWVTISDGDQPEPNAVTYTISPEPEPGEPVLIEVAFFGGTEGNSIIDLFSETTFLFNAGFSEGIPPGEEGVFNLSVEGETTGDSDTAWLGIMGLSFQFQAEIPPL